MKKILAFGASNSQNSINKKFALYAASLFNDATVDVLDLNDYEMPIYSIDREKSTGIPELAQQFFDKIQSSDITIISFAEHNGAYTTTFKNIFDWVSRINNKFLDTKQMLLLSTSPGPRGGATVLQMATDRLPRHGANIKASFSLPSFNDNFDDGDGITNLELKNKLTEIISENF